MVTTALANTRGRCVASKQGADGGLRRNSVLLYRQCTSAECLFLLPCGRGRKEGRREKAGGRAGGWGLAVQRDAFPAPSASTQLLLAPLPYTSPHMIVSATSWNTWKTDRYAGADPSTVWGQHQVSPAVGMDT